MNLHMHNILWQFCSRDNSASKFPTCGLSQYVHDRTCEYVTFRWDPKVPDGTSLAGPFGLDSKKYPNLTSKADQPGPLPEFQEKVSS